MLPLYTFAEQDFQTGRSWPLCGLRAIDVLVVVIQLFIQVFPILQIKAGRPREAK